MGWQPIVALMPGAPLILLSVASVWHLNIGGLYKVTRATVVAKTKAMLEKKQT